MIVPQGLHKPYQLSDKVDTIFMLCYTVRTGQDLACFLSLEYQATGSSPVPLPSCWVKIVHFTDELQ